MTCGLYQAGDATVFACSGTWRARGCVGCSKLAPDACDGCSKPLCSRCSVSPRPGFDFCPTCARPVFLEWYGSPEGKTWNRGAAALKLADDVLRELRRKVFRRWAIDHADRFEPLRSTHSARRAAAASIPLSVRMVRELSPAMKVDLELKVMREKLPHVLIDTVMVPEGSEIHAQWKLEQG